MTDRPQRKSSRGRPAPASAERDQALRDRVAELEQQVTALRFAAEQGDLVREQFADLYDYAPVGYLTVDAEGAIRRVNVPAAALLGGSRQDLANRKLVTLVRPDDKARFTAFLKEAFTTSSPASVEVGLVRGKWRAEHLQFVASPAAGGRDLGHPGAQARLAVLDVTDRWRAQEALRESRDRFQAVIASMAEGVVVHDATGAIRDCNTAAQRILGLSEDELLGRRSVDPRWRAVHEDGMPFPGERHPAMEVIRTGASQWNVPMGVHRPDGSLVWLRVSADPLRNADGSVRGAVATFSDVTEERRREAERAELLERLSFVIDGSDDGFWDWDVATGTVTFSRRWAQMFGYDVGELEPGVATWERMIHPEDREPAWSALRRHFAGEVEQHVVETRLRHRDGHWVRVVVRGKVVARDAAGTPLRMAGTYSDVTRRAEMEQALAASEKRFQDLVSGMRDGLVVLQDGGVVFANPAAARLHGLEDPSAMRGSPAREFVDAASLSAIEETDRRLLAQEAVAPVDVTVASKDGTVRIAEALASLVPFGGRPAIQVVLRDVTEQRRLRAEVERGRAQLAQVLDASMDGHFEADVASGEVRVSRRWNEIAGRPPDAGPIPMPEWEALVHPADRAAAGPEMAAAREGRSETLDLTYRIRRPDGEWRWVRTRGKVAERDARGVAVRLVGATTDVHARVTAQEELRRSRELLSHLIEHAPASIAMLDREMRYLAASRRWLETHDLLGKAFVGQVLYDLHPGIPEHWRDVHRRALAGVAHAAEERTAAPGRAHEEIVRWEIQPWRSAGGEVGGIVIFSEIVTEQRALQAQLMASSKLEALGTFVGGMAHEINNPLAAEMAQSGIAADLVRDARDGIAGGDGVPGGSPVALLDEALDALHDARESSQRIAAIVRDLVKLGRQDRGAERLRLRSVVDEARRWLASPRYAGVEVRVEDTGAPDVTGVESQILQVVVALLTNARQSIAAGRSGVVTVRLGPGGPGTSRVEVEDDGEGMTAEVLSRAFDPFFTTRGVGQGVGLGLSVAHAIATAHGGTLTATSRPGAGSTFRLELPVAASPEDGEVVTPG
ncbi:MAG TPA: PAS domain S-box protein [Anaeromyxobacteraceae bacterium]|nr:PAS domain S-box protein [Anaeromyxobacteraceae bacterium]